MHKMAVLQLSILLHYYCHPDDWPGDNTNETVFKCFSELLIWDLLAAEPQISSCRSEYRITKRGEAYVRGILETPLPVQQWVIPGREG